jgi:hypothetical protein
MKTKTMNFAEWITSKGITAEEFKMAAPEHKATLEAEFKAAFKAAKHEDKPVAVKPTTAKKGANMKVAKKTAEKKVSSGARIRELILKGMSNDVILPIIKKEFKGGKTTTGDVSWNRSMLKAGKFNAPKKVLTNAEALAKTAKK